MLRNINVNSIIEWLDGENSRLERILWIDNDGKETVTIELFSHNPLPQWKYIFDIESALEKGEAIKRTVDPFASFSVHDSKVLIKHREHRDRAWDLIKDIVNNEPDIYRSEGRGLLLHEVSQKHNVHVMTVYKNLRKYWIGGKIKNALLPAFDKCGAPGEERKFSQGKKRGRPPKESKLYPEKVGINVDEDTKRIISASIRLYYNNKKRRPLKQVYELMLQHFFIQGYQKEGNVEIPILIPANERPTYGQFRYWFLKEMDLRKTLIARVGKKEFNLRKRAVLGSSTPMASGPGSIFQIDATIGDIYLVSRYDRTKIIGRPVIYLVVDVLSRMIVGLYIGLSGPNWVGAMMALANATIDKVGFCSEYGIEITPEQWPCSYLPEMILADRGEIEGVNGDYLADSLNIVVANTPPYRADLKGIVEQQFRRANLKVIHWLPGAVRERLRKPGEMDHRLDATLDLNQFSRIMIQTVLDYNLNHWMKWYSRDEFMIQSQVNPIPIDLWRWGLKNRSGHLREKSPETIILSLLPRGEAVVTFEGIRFEGMYFSCERALKEQWFEKARSYGSWHITVAYDPRSTDQIYLLLNDGKEIEVCELLKSEKRYKGYRLEEVQDLHELESIEEKLYTSEKEIQANVELNVRINAIVKEAEEQTKIALNISQPSNRERIGGIRENRSTESEKLDKKMATAAKKGPNGEVSLVNNLNIDELAEIKTKPNNQTHTEKKKSILQLLKNQPD